MGKESGWLWQGFKLYQAFVVAVGDWLQKRRLPKWAGPHSIALTNGAALGAYHNAIVVPAHR